MMSTSPTVLGNAEVALLERSRTSDAERGVAANAEARRLTEVGHRSEAMARLGGHGAQNHKAPKRGTV